MNIGRLRPACHNILLPIWLTDLAFISASTQHNYAEALSSMSTRATERPCYYRCTDSQTHSDHDKKRDHRCVLQPANSSSSSKEQTHKEIQLHSPSSINIFSSSPESSPDVSSSNQHNSSSSSSSSSLHRGTVFVQAPWTTLGFVAHLLAFWIIRTLSRHFGIGLT